MTIRTFLMTCLLLLSWQVQAACYGDQKAANRALVFAPVPQLPAPTLFARWVPVLQAVGIETGQCFDLVIKPSIPEFEQFLFKDEPALAYVNPYHAVMAHKARGYTPLLADGSTLLSGILVVSKGGDIRQLADLQGRRVDFPAPNAFGASLLLRAHLKQAQIHIEPRYVKTHTNVYRDVILGDASAGGGVNRTLMSEPEEVQQRLRVLYETPGYRSHPVIASPKLPRPLQARILAAFESLARSEKGRALLAGVQLNTPIAVSYQKDYQPLEHLGLEKLVVQDE